MSINTYRFIFIPQSLVRACHIKSATGARKSIVHHHLNCLWFCFLLVRVAREHARITMCHSIQLCFSFSILFSLLWSSWPCGRVQHFHYYDLCCHFVWLENYIEVDQIKLCICLLSIPPFRCVHSAYCTVRTTQTHAVRIRANSRCSNVSKFNAIVIFILECAQHL